MSKRTLFILVFFAVLLVGANFYTIWPDEADFGSKFIFHNFFSFSMIFVDF